MIVVRRAAERLLTRIDWLESRHTFSWEKHCDPRHMGFRALRALNEDRIAPGTGFAMQSRREVEIVTVVLAGTLGHQDSLGREVFVGPGGVQRLTAGTGVLHREFNASDRAPLHLVQMWISPAKSRLRPNYQNRHFPAAAHTDGFRLIVSSDGRGGSLSIYQDSCISTARLAGNGASTYELAPARYGWIQVLSGDATINDVALNQGDGAALMDERVVSCSSTRGADLMLIDLA